MHIAVVGLSHRTAPVEVREKLSIPEQTMEESLQNLRGHDQVLEASILSTCNRLEIYTLVRNPELGISAVREFLSGIPVWRPEISSLICSPITMKTRWLTCSGWPPVSTVLFLERGKSFPRSRR